MYTSGRSNNTGIIAIQEYTYRNIVVWRAPARPSRRYALMYYAINYMCVIYVLLSNMEFIIYLLCIYSFLARSSAALHNANDNDDNTNNNNGNNHDNNTNNSNTNINTNNTSSTLQCSFLARSSAALLYYNII